MESSPTIAAIAVALVAAQTDIKAAHKSGDNKFDRYRYSKLEDFFDAAKPVLAKHGLALVIGNPSVHVLPERATKAGGSEHACQVCITATLIHVSGEWLRIATYGEGQDRADKSIYKAITGAKKYALAGLLAIPTTDDPEADEQVGQSAAVPARPTWNRLPLQQPVAAPAPVPAPAPMAAPVAASKPDQKTRYDSMRAQLVALFGEERTRVVIKDCTNSANGDRELILVAMLAAIAEESRAKAAQ
jgi:hypothetical protein